MRLTAILTVLGLAFIGLADRPATGRPAKAEENEPHRSPIALALTPDGTRLLTANQTSGTVSLIDTEGRRVLDEVATGEKPAGVAISRDGRRGVVANWYGYDLAILDIDEDKIKVAGRVEVGPEPRGVAISNDGKTAYVAVGISNEVVRVDLMEKKVTGRVEVGREPRGIALTPDGWRLLVANSRAATLSVITTPDFKVERTLPLQGTNFRQVAVTADGTMAYVANMYNRGFATTKPNIDVGWVLGQRLTRVPIDGSETFETLSLDPQGQAVADAHGAGVSADGRFLAVACGGTHEVVIFRTDGRRLPWRSGGSRDLLALELFGDQRFRRVPLGGRPTEIAFAPDGKTLYVANYLSDSIQIVDAENARLIGSIPLGGPSEISLVRRGEALFHDGTRSFNQWYSCNTCHSDGHTNGLDYDTMNDGWHDLSTSHRRSRKKVPTLRRVVHTGPWTWHGWQESLDDAMSESFTKSMQGPRPTEDETRALVAFLGTLDYPRNPYLKTDGSLTPAAERGREVYRSAEAACNTCHGGPELTDGKIHDVGLGERGDVFKGYNPPSLRGLYDKDPYLHDGRAADLRSALTGAHSPEEVTGLGSLNDGQMADLIEYLKSL